MSGRTWIILISLLAGLALCEDVFSGSLVMRSLVPRGTPDGWALRGVPQTFGKKTLFEHINGQADLFLQYGFERAIFAVYETSNSGNERIDLNIYDMGNTVQAFGVFSRFRQDDHSAGIGLGSYVENGYMLFYKGRFFAALQGTESGPSSLVSLARIIESRIVDSSPEPKEVGYFPKSGLKPGSIEYYPKGLMGREFLKRGFKASYRAYDPAGANPLPADEGPESTLFIAIFDNTDEAKRALKAFNDVLTKKGNSQPAVQTQPGFDTLKGEDAYQGRFIVVRKGPYLAGAVGFPVEQDARRLLAELTGQIK